MTRLNKRELLREVERGFESGGWSVLHLSVIGKHPAVYRVSDGDRHYTVRVYIWNISHGGGRRSATEFRIQITGLSSNQLIPEPGGKTLILNQAMRRQWEKLVDIFTHTSVLDDDDLLAATYYLLLQDRKILPYRMGIEHRC